MIHADKVDKPLSLTITSHNGKPYVSSIELFDVIMPNSRRYYAHWIHINITHQPQNLPKNGADYLHSKYVKGYKKPVRTPGRKREDILLSIQFARELCYQAKTIPANEAREFLRSFSA